MRHLLSFPALMLMLNVFPGVATGQTAATTTLAANPTTITVGSSVGLAATVQPNSAPGAGKTVPRPSGTITFLDGSTSLSSAPIALAPNGIASATFPQTFGTPDPSLTAGELVGDLNGDGVQDLLIYGYATPFPLQTFTSNGKGGYNASAVQTFSFSAWVHSAAHRFQRGRNARPSMRSSGRLWKWGWDLRSGGSSFVSFQRIPHRVRIHSRSKRRRQDRHSCCARRPVTQERDYLRLRIQFSSTRAEGPSHRPEHSQLLPSLVENPWTLLAPVIVDLNGDGKPDLITQIQTFGPAQSQGPQSVDVLLNQGDGTFGPYMPVTIANGPNIGPGAEFPFGIAAGDVNGDGKPDLVLTVSDIEANLDAIVLLGNGDGTFQPAIYFILAQLENAQGIPYYQTPSVVIEDLNLDGKQDLVFSNGQVGLGNGDGTFVLSSPLFPLQLLGEDEAYSSFPLVQVTLPSSLEPSLVYLLPTATPPAASVFTPQTSSSATISPSTLAVGTHSITARYSGDANYSADTSAAVSVTVNQAASATASHILCQPEFCRTERDVDRECNQPRAYTYRQRDLHLGIDHSGYGRSQWRIGRVYDFFLHHSGHANHHCLLFRGCEHAGFLRNAQPGGQRRVHPRARWRREHHPDSQRRSDSERAHQRDRRTRILWPGHLCLLRSAGEYQLQLQPGNHQPVWHARCSHAAFGEYGCGLNH